MSGTLKFFKDRADNNDAKATLLKVLRDPEFGLYDNGFLREWIDTKEFHRRLDVLSINAEKDCGLKVIKQNDAELNSIGLPLQFGENIEPGFFKTLGSAFYKMQYILADRCADFAIEKSNGKLHVVPEKMDPNLLGEVKKAIGIARDAIIEVTCHSYSTPQQIESLMTSFLIAIDTGTLHLATEEALFDVRQKAAALAKSK